MKISDELIACYVEGTVTAEERNFVRKYLCEHPEEYERVLCLMDNDTVDYLGEQLEISDNCIPLNETSFSDIACSAAAFAPEQNSSFRSKGKHVDVATKPTELYDKLSRVWEEIDMS